MVRSGSTLYVDAIDNKSPVVYLLAGLIDGAPGPFEVVRALLVGVLVAWIATSIHRLIPGERNPVFLPVALGLTAALLSEFRFTVELAAVALLLEAFAQVRSGSPAIVVLLVASAAAFDIRVPLLFPGVVLAIGHLGTPRAARRAAWSLTAITLTALTVVLIVPDLRYGLIELNTASRPEARPLAMLVAFLVSALPLLSLRYSERSARPTPALWALAVAALLIGFGSIIPTPHYWTYLLLPVPLLVIGEPSCSPPRLKVAVFVVACLPLLWGAVIESVGQTRELPRHEAAAAALEATLEPGEGFVFFGGQPYVTRLRPAQALLRSPSMYYLFFPTSRTDAHRAELPRLIHAAAAVVDEGALDRPPDEFPADQRELLQAFERVSGEFPTVCRYGGVTVRLRNGECPASVAEQAYGPNFSHTRGVP
jgi:hypothetical protein